MDSKTIRLFRLESQGPVKKVLTIPKCCMASFLQIFMALSAFVASFSDSYLVSL